MRTGRRFHQVLAAALIVSSIVAVVGLMSCGGSDGAAADEEGRGDVGTLTVFAASSLTEAFGELAKTFKEQTLAPR